MMLFQTNGECELQARWLCQNGSVCALIFPFKIPASFWEGLGQNSHSRQVSGDIKASGTRVWSPGNGLPWALGTLLAAWQGWGPKVEWESRNSCMLGLSCVCQGRLPWVWEKLGCFASLTLEHGDELIKPLGNWTSVTFTLDQYKYVSHFLVSKTLQGERAHLECCTEEQLSGSSQGASQVQLVHGELLLPHPHLCMSDVAVRCFSSTKSRHFWATCEYLCENKLPSDPRKCLWCPGVILLTQSRCSK